MADAFPALGAHFLKDGDEVMFKFVVDPNNVIGPVKATDQHKEQYPIEWEAFTQNAPRPTPRAADSKMRKLAHKKPAKKKAKA